MHARVLQPDISFEGLAYDQAKFASLMQIDRTAALREIDDQKNLFERFGDRTPAALLKQQGEVRKRVESAAEVWNPAV